MAHESVISELCLVTAVVTKNLLGGNKGGISVEGDATWALAQRQSICSAGSSSLAFTTASPGMTDWLDALFDCLVKLHAQD